MSDWSAGRPPQARRQQAGYDYYGRPGAVSPARRRPAPPPPPGGRVPPPEMGLPPRRPRWGRRIGIVLLVLVVALVGFVVYLDATLQRKPALAGTQAPPTAGTNWLLVGSDSRQGIDQSQGQQLGTGDQSDVAGGRTDTMMIMHLPAGGGGPALISLPRDSYVPIPGHGSDKLNAAYAYGGPTLLVQTVENATGLHINHYAEIGLDGFANLVNDVGGVNMCIDQPMVDPKANLNLQPGCQVLNGDQALGYVRTRNFPLGDLQRIEDQRKLVSALVHQASSPATFLNPFRLFPLMADAPQTFTVDSGDHIWNLFWLGMAMTDLTSGNGVTASVPVGGFATRNGQSVLLWNKSEASQMFNAIAQDQPIPQSALAGQPGG